MIETAEPPPCPYDLPPHEFAAWEAVWATWEEWDADEDAIERRILSTKGKFVEEIEDDLESSDDLSPDHDGGEIGDDDEAIE